MNSRSFLSLSTAALALAVGAAAGCTALDTGVVFSAPGTTTTIIMVRHAERDEGFDPPLNEEGLVRAQALADELETQASPRSSTPTSSATTRRPSPLAERVNPIIRVYSQLESADTKAMANDFVQEVLDDHAGGVVLWIGNTGPVIEGVQSGNLQEIYARLGGTGNPPIQYRSLYTIVLRDDMPPSITTGIYGGSSSLD